MAETTCGCALLNICPDRPSSSLASSKISFQSLRSFRVPDHGTEADLDMNTEKDFEIAQNDIHLEVMGIWKNSLFPEMYKLPESLMCLLSQTIRLANEQELLHRDTIFDADVVMNLNRRTKILEHHILSWKPERIHTRCDSETEQSTYQQTSQPAPHYLALAMHQGIILFYYRRVHNINALMLQDTVRKVLYYAQKSDESNEDGNQCGPSSLWPCFLAACEALEPDLQTQLLEWLLTVGRRSSIPSFAAAADMVQDVWKKRQETSDYTFSWFDVVHQDRSPIITV